LLVELADGTQFSVGTGFSDAERGAPPAVGSVITFRYQELSDGGVPRFPSYVGVRGDSALPTVPPASRPPAAEVPPPGRPSESASSTARRFELVEGSSSKFWEVARDGCSVTVRFGRIGTSGHAKTKDFASEELARRNADGLIEEKLDKGYLEGGR
jgi:DNA ligase-1